MAGSSNWGGGSTAPPAVRGQRCNGTRGERAAPAAHSLKILQSDLDSRERRFVMPEKPQPVPPGFHTLTLHLIVRDAARAITFYEKAFGAQLLGKMLTPDGKVMHAAMKVGDSMMMLNDEFPEWGALSPVSNGGSGVTLHM